VRGAFYAGNGLDVYILLIVDPFENADEEAVL
jgi:hypothetical protein